MKQARLFMMCSIGLAAFALMTPTATAAEIKTKKDCEASDGVAMKNRGVLTCTLPLMEAENRDSERSISTCAGEVVANGAFCRIVVDPRMKDKKPNCNKVERALSNLSEEEALAAADVPMSDAWVCARNERIKKQRAR